MPEPALIAAASGFLGRTAGQLVGAKLKDTFVGTEIEKALSRAYRVGIEHFLDGLPEGWEDYTDALEGFFTDSQVAEEFAKLFDPFGESGLDIGFLEGRIDALGLDFSTLAGFVLEDHVRALEGGFRTAARGESSLATNLLLEGQDEIKEQLRQLKEDPDRRVVDRPLHTLPPVVGDFVGREDVVSEATERLAGPKKGGSPRIVALHGPGGIGKSQAAYRVAHDDAIAAEFPDGRLYLNLRGQENRPVSPESAIETLLAALGVPTEHVPGRPEDAANLYRSLLSDRSVLILLDNAQDRAQVQPLIPGADSCGVLVTSRRSLGIPGALERRVEPLDHAAGTDLLAELVGPERVGEDPKAVANVLRLCGGFPLAIRLAGVIAARREWCLDELALRLERTRLELLEDPVPGREPTAEDSVRASFQLSYDLLSDAERRLYRRLGWLGLPDFALGYAAALDGEDQETTEARLFRLQDECLLDATGAGQFLIHDLLREYASERALAEDEATDLDAAFHRALAWYTGTAKAMDSLLRANHRYLLANTIAEETGVDVSSIHHVLERIALTWFDSEYARLLTIIEVAEGHHAWEAQAMLVVALTKYMVDLRSHWSDAVKVGERVRDIARSRGDRHVESTILGNLGAVYAQQGRWDDANAAFKQAQTLDRDLGDHHGEALTQSNLGNVRQLQGRWMEAIAAFERAQAILHDHGDHHTEAVTLNSLGIVYQHQGRWDDAIAAFEQARVIFHDLGDHHGVGHTLNNLGNVYRLQGLWNEAIAASEQARAIFHDLGDRHGEGEAIGNLGNVYRQQGHLKEAYAAFDQTLAISRDLGDPQGEAIALSNLGVVYGQLGHFGQAIECIEQAQKSLRNLGDRYGAAHALRNLGTVYQNQGRWDDSIAVFEHALTVLHELGDRHGEGVTLNNLGTIYQQKRRDQEAIAAFEQAREIFLSLGDRHGEGIALVNLGGLFGEQGNTERGLKYISEALERLHPDSPEYAQIADWLAEWGEEPQSGPV